VSRIRPVTLDLRPVTLELSGELDITAASALGAAVSCLPVIAVDLLPRHPIAAEALPFWTMTWRVAEPVR